MEFFFQRAFDIAKNTVEEHFWSGVAIVSAIIFIIGILKPFIFDKIKNAHLRKVSLAGTDFISSLISTAIYFSIEGITFEKYWVGSSAIFVFSIVVYWLYENTCLRLAIHKIGEKVVTKILNFFSKRRNTSNNFKSLSSEIRLTAKQEISKYNDEFDGL